jgi:hypothetical protein
MAELITVLAYATKQVKQGRLSMFALANNSHRLPCGREIRQKNLVEKEIESVLDRLDRLTLEESKMTVAQTYDVFCRLINKMQVVMEGTVRILSTYGYIHGTKGQSGR